LKKKIEQALLHFDKVHRVVEIGSENKTKAPLGSIKLISERFDNYNDYNNNTIMNY
jgi:hypothetical protein